MSKQSGVVPPAPTRTRRTLTSRTPTISSINIKNNSEDLSNGDDALVKDLTALTLGSTIKKSTKATTTTTASVPSTSTSKPRIPGTTSKSISSTASKPQLTPMERAREAMKVINVSLQTISNINKSGFKAISSNNSTPTTIITTITNSSRPTLKSKCSSSSINSVSSSQIIKENVTKIESATESCSKALEELRSLILEKKINNKLTEMEKASGSLIANLVEMELYALALPQLALMRFSLLSHFSDPARLTIPPRSSVLAYIPILSLPLPHNPTSISLLEVIPLVLAIQQYTLGCIFRSELTSNIDITKRIELVSRTFQESGSPLEWKKIFDQEIESRRSRRSKDDEMIVEGDEVKVLAEEDAVNKRIDSMLTSMFGTITKGCIGADTLALPESVISLRSRALLFYASTRPLYLDSTKLEAFYEQTRKVLLLYGRRAEELKVGDLQINEVVKTVVKELAVVLEEKKHRKEGKAWRTLCEVGLHIAKRADDLAMIEQCSNWIGLEITAVDSETQVSQICARLIKATSVIDFHLKYSIESIAIISDTSIMNQFIIIRNSIPLLTNLKSQGEEGLSVESHTKIDKVLGRLQYNFIKRIKGSKRVDQLMCNTGEKKSKLGELESSMINVLNDLAGHAESLSSESLVSDAIESLLLLAYSHFSVDDRTTHTPTHLFLERCLPLLSFTATNISISTHHYSIRSLASAYFNIGGTLFNLGKCSDSIRFTKRACEITRVAVKSWDLLVDVEEEEVKKSIDDLKRYLPKRWECLAMAQQAIGEKMNAYESYISAIIDQSDETWRELSMAAETSPISSFVIRFVSIYKLLQRATKISCFELSRPDSTSTLLSLNSRMEAIGTNKISSSVIGALLELQILCLDSNLDKPEALVAIREMLESLLSIYSVEEYPIRRARTLVRIMQNESSPSMLKEDLSMVTIASEIKELHLSESFGNDDSLRIYSHQYLAYSHIWLGFHFHQRQAVLSSTIPSHSIVQFETTSTEARTALRILRDSLDAELPTSPSAPIRKIAGPPTPINKSSLPISPKLKSVRRGTRATGVKSAFKTPMVSRTRPGGVHTINLITPPSRGVIDLSTGKSRSSREKNDNSKLLLDDSERCYALLETMSNLLGALGFSLLRISYLKFLRRLGSKNKSLHEGAFVTASAHLGHEYLRLGKTIRAGLIFAQAETRISNGIKSGSSIPPEAQVLFYTYYAEYLSVLGNQDRSTQAYEDARKLTDNISPASSSSGTSAILDRTLLLQRSATAAGICSKMLQRKGDLSSALGPALQALRVWSRAIRNLSRLTVLSVDPITDDTVAFTSNRTDRNAPLPDHPTYSSKGKTVHLGTPNSSLAWQIAEGLLSSMLRVATIYLIRGTPKSAEYYAEQAVHFSEDIGSSRLLARAMVVRAEVRLQSHNLLETRIDLDRMDELLGLNSSCPEAIDTKRLRADLLLKERSSIEAHQLYVSAQRSLDSFVQAAAEGEIEASPVKAHAALNSSISRSPAIISPSPRQVSGVSDAILPATLAHILRMRVGLLRSEDKQDESANVLRRLARLTSSPEDRADELRLLATIQLEDLLSKFHSDSVLDTVLSIPVLGVVTVKSNAPMSNSPLIPTSILKEIDNLLARAITLSVSRVEPSKLRELSVVTSSLRALQATVGKSSKRSATDVASLLDLGVAVALRREMLHAIESKLEKNVLHDDTLWPSTELMLSETSDNDPITNYWLSVRERYRTESAEPIMTEPAFSTLLPTGWTVASLHLTVEKDCLILVRHRKSEEPLVFKMPLDRQARRENEDETLSYFEAIGELKDIIARSNAGTQRAKHVDGKVERASWWKERIELDARLKLLTESMEETWLGAFKSLLLAPRAVSPSALATFGSQVEAVLRRSIVRSPTTKAARFKFDSGILAALSALPSDARDEDLEDLFYYMTESLQLPSDETDVDQVVCDLRTALEELHSEPNSESLVKDDHTFLILDKSLQSFPWESIPCLRGRSVSRLPALSFLRDRIDLAALLSSGPETTSKCEIIVNPTKTSFVLNPSGDLKNTQDVFEPWLKSKKEEGWSGIIGRAPSDEEMKLSLSKRDLFLYFGHGGAEQYVRSQTIRNLSRCAVTMLWGCSSGMLKDVGDHDPTGTPYHYLIAGCPALVANLWDVTDKDIDKLAGVVFEKLGLKGEDTTSSPGVETTSATLASAVGGSRDVCNLRYLNGAAPVVYGVPVRFLNKKLT